MTAPLRRVSAGLLIAFAIVALALGYWNILRGAELLARPDNPRAVLAERRIQRGQILDRNGAVLAGTAVDAQSGFATRQYPYPEASPVVGYYSLRYGTGGIEAAYDGTLRGDISLSATDRILNGLLHRPQVGGDVRLTIDLALQQTADQLLEGFTGAVVLLNVPQGEVLAMSSHPTFDSSRLAEDWERLAADAGAPLLNRVTQGQYQPGTILQSVVLAAAADSRTATPQDTVGGMLSVRVGDELLPCAAAPQTASTLADSYALACPAPFQSVALRTGAQRLDAVLADFGLLEAPLFPLPTEPAGQVQPPAQNDLLLTAVGQSSLTVSPLQMALVAAAFADHGRMPAPQIVQATRSPGGTWEPATTEGYPRGTISRASADAIAELMLQAVEQGAARAAARPGYPIRGHSGLALSGLEAATNAWFIGFAPSGTDQAIAVAVLLEDTDGASQAAHIGGEMLRAALDSSH